MKYTYYSCDVFTDRIFGGNQLAVFPEAEGLSSEQMQQIAREFNYSETSFVFPPEHGGTRRVRIFTPSAEIPFAGHPNIGTACVLAHYGFVEDAKYMNFEEAAGDVILSRIPGKGGKALYELQAPEAFAIGAEISPEEAAAALSLSRDEIKTDIHAPVTASAGLPFLFVELGSMKALERAVPDISMLRKMQGKGIISFIHLYYREGEKIWCRMYAPLDGVLEDPATGSANCALAGLLTYLSGKREESFSIVQGVEMGRPSFLHARAQRTPEGAITCFVSGESVMVMEGIIPV